MQGPSPFRKVWGAPLLLAALTLFGLLAALLGTGIWHWASWLTLTVPIAVMGWYCRPGRKESHGGSQGS